MVYKGFTQIKNISIYLSNNQQFTKYQGLQNINFLLNNYVFFNGVACLPSPHSLG